MELAVFGILLTLGLLLGVIFGWIAFFRTARLAREVGELRAQVGRLTDAIHAAPPIPPAASLTAEAPPPAHAPPAAVIEAPAPTGAPTVDASPASPPPVAARAPAAAIATTSAPSAPAGRNVFRDLEASLSGNWLVWVAGAAMALGGVFLVKVAIDAGLLGPWARILLALAAGLAMLGASEWLRRKGFDALPALAQAPAAARSAAPAVTAGAGVVTVYGAIYAAFGLYELIPAPAAFALLAAAAAGCAGLALLHGPALVALGLVGAFVAPLLIGSDDPRAGPLFAYVFAVAGAGLAITRLVGRRWPAFVALTGGVLWALLWIDQMGGAQAWALSLFLPAMLAAAIAFAWDQAADAPTMAASKALVKDAPVAVAAAYAAAVAVFMVLIVLLGEADYQAVVVASLAALSTLSLAAAWRREALFALPLVAAVGVGLALYGWPDASAVFIGPDLSVERAIGTDGAVPASPPYLSVCLAFAALFGLGGLFAQDRLRMKGAMATVAAGAPTVILAIAFWKITGLEQDWRWASAAVLLAAAYTLLLERLARTKEGADAFPGPVSAYALGACGAAGMAVGMALDQLWMSVGFAILAPVAALLHRRFHISLLQWAAVAFGLLATARLTIFGEVFRYDVGATPILNGLLWGYGAPILAIWAAARIFMADGLKRDGQVVQALNAKALLLAVALVSMQIHHLLNDGQLDRLYLDSLLEVGLQSSAWFAGALALRWRLGPKLFFVQRWAERLLIGAAVAQTVFIQLWWINPWWGGSPGPIAGPPIANELFVAYALPALLAALYAFVARRQGFERIGTAAGLAGAGLGFAWVTLETRHAFHPIWLAPYNPDGGRQPVGDVEAYAYSAVWLVFSGLLLGLGALRRRPSMRYAALALLIVVTLKVFIFDMAGLQGLLRGLSFIGLGAALMAIALLYQRLWPTLAKQDAAAGA